MSAFNTTNNTSNTPAQKRDRKRVSSYDQLVSDLPPHAATAFNSTLGSPKTAPAPARTAVTQVDFAPCLRLALRRLERYWFACVSYA